MKRLIPAVFVAVASLSGPTLAIDGEWTPIRPRLCAATTERWLDRYVGEDGRGTFDSFGRLTRGFVLNDFNSWGATIVGQLQELMPNGTYRIAWVEIGATTNPRLRKPGICIKAQRIEERGHLTPQ